MANSQLLTKRYANSRNAPNSTAAPNKPPILPKLSTNYDSKITNKANFQKVKMKLNFYSTKHYENQPRLRTPGKQTQSNPTCRGVASGEAGSNPISKDALSQVLFNRVFLCLFILILKQTIKRRLGKACFASCRLNFTVKSFRKSKYILFTKRCKIDNYWRIKYPKILLNNRKEFLDGS